ncbi:hypothetical protein QUC31_011662, partial [Theobroma cacao]
MKRWTKNAKDDAPVVVDDNFDPKYQTMLRMEGHTRNKCPQLELTLRSLDSSSCLLDDNDVDICERNKEVWPSQLETLFGGDSSK